MATKEPCENGRTHEPNLREITADVDGLRELMQTKFQAVHDLLEERDKRYTERADDQKVAVLTALAAMDKQTFTAFAASEKAIIKAEDAQREYNARSNEFRGQLDDQAKTFMPRVENNILNDAFDKRLLAMKSESDTKLDGFQKVYSVGHESLRNEIAGLRESRVETRGHSAGSIQLWGFILSGFALISGVVTTVAVIVHLVWGR